MFGSLCVCHHTSLLVCPPQPASQPLLVAWHLSDFALETIDPVLVSQCTFTHHRNHTIKTCKERKPFYILNSKAYPSHQPWH